MSISPLADWTPRPPLAAVPLAGQHVRLEPLDWPVHLSGLFAAVAGPANRGLWHYMPIGPFDTQDQFRGLFEQSRQSQEWETLVFRTCGGAVGGMASFMRVRPEHGGAEIGAVAFGPALRRTTAATEGLMLMADHVFGLGYRRLEWKCDNANAASRRAAERFGFTFEGLFRQHMVRKGENRDTAWFSIIDGEWPARRAALLAWLDPGNFTPDGAQLRPLEYFR